MAAGDSDREEIVQGLLKSHQPRAPSETARGFFVSLIADPAGAKAQPRGRLAQLVERFVYTEDVGSSSLSSPTIFYLQFQRLAFVLARNVWQLCMTAMYGS